MDFSLSMDYYSSPASRSTSTYNVPSNSLIWLHTRSLTASGLQLDRPSPVNFRSNDIEIPTNFVLVGPTLALRQPAAPFRVARSRIRGQRGRITAGRPWHARAATAARGTRAQRAATLVRAQPEIRESGSVLRAVFDRAVHAVPSAVPPKPLPESGGGRRAAAGRLAGRFGRLRVFGPDFRPGRSYLDIFGVLGHRQVLFGLSRLVGRNPPFVIYENTSGNLQLGEAPWFFPFLGFPRKNSWCSLFLSVCVLNLRATLGRKFTNCTAAYFLTRNRANDEVISFPNEAEQWFLRVSSSLSELEFSFLKSLESLPSSLESLSSLQKLSIGPSVRMLRELPNLPPSLEYLYVRGCHPELKEHYREDGGSDRHKIAHIPHISIW
ncbi:hypothetical protein KFK09_009988 [Dendrobium nobile]|uniref:Uncharacterized protein n=1 Tax=Dendrobium nobile TaxID=94219 RepID=A0A8T3BP48_DENNO|nr:hypothetical protein KFK09_009988 [Dendrobium nobile]